MNVAVQTTDKSLIIASQLDARFNDFLQGKLPDALALNLRTQEVKLKKIHPIGVVLKSFHPGDFEQLAQAEVLLASPQGWPKQAPQGWPFQLKWIQLASTGIDFYPEWLFNGVRVTTSRGATSLPIVEYVLDALFRQYKRLASFQIHDAKDWQRKDVPLLAGSTLGIVGYGSIGQLLAQYAQALGINVLVLKRSQAAIQTAIQTIGEGVEQVANIQALIQRVDHLVLAAPATPQTHHLINAGVLAQAKHNLHLINVARGSLIDQQALIAALDQGLLAHATLDVTTPEPLPANHPLYTHPKVTITPHTSATASSVLPAVFEQFKDNLWRYLNEEPLANPVDLSRGY